MFDQTGNLVGMVDKTGIIRLIVQIIMGLLLGIVLMLVSKRFFYHVKPNGKKNICMRIITLITSLSILIFVSSNIGNNNSKLSVFLRGNYNINFTGFDWSQAENYNANGFVPAFIYNITNAPKLDKPEGYSKEKIEEITKKYSRIESTNNGRPNIVFILSESFIDPLKHINELPLSEDPIPYYHELATKYPSGESLVFSYGGGTARMEFELLTGISNYYVQHTAYQTTIPRLKSIPTTATYFKQLGYNTLGIHPSSGELYKRNTNYPKMGFDKFYDDSKMENIDNIEQGSYISDYSFFKEVIEKINDTDAPNFVMGISMQNHQGYHSYNYNKTIEVNTDKLSDSDKSRMEIYLQGLRHSDNALKDFISQLNDLPRDTIVMYFGDHYPGSSVYAQEMTNNVTDYLTPLLFYSTSKDFEQADSLGIMSLSQITPTILKKLGLPLSGYYHLLSEVEKEVKALSGEYQLDENGNKIENFDDSTEVMRDYNMIIYDILNGNQYAEKNGFFFIDD